MNRIDERVKRIKKDHELLLSMVKDSLEKNRDSLSKNTNEVLNVIEFDEQNIKKYESLIKAQKLIIDLAKQVLECSNPEEIIKLRKQINYYINKIKNELKKRGISEERINDFQNSVTYLRKDISKYLRFQKRNSNLKKIDNLSENYQGLSPLDKKELRKLLNNERKYNYQNLRNVNKTSEKKELAVESISNNVKSQVVKNESQEVLNDNYIIDYFEEKITKYKSQYKIRDTYDYTLSFWKNIASLIKNIPIYMRNKKIIHAMEDECTVYYNGSDFISYIEYTRKKNSIHSALYTIFNKSYLFTSEGKYLNNHELCANWLIEFCRYNNLPINYLRKTVKNA